MWRYQEEVGLKAPEALCDTIYYYRAHTHTHTVIPVKIERGFLAVTERCGGVVLGGAGERSDVVSAVVISWPFLKKLLHNHIIQQKSFSGDVKYEANFFRFKNLYFSSLESF